MKYSMWRLRHLNANFPWACLRIATMYKFWTTPDDLNVEMAGKLPLLAPGICDSNFDSIIFEHILQIRFMHTSCEIDFRWMPRETYNDKSTSIQLSAWCRHATSQCWPRSSPCCIELMQMKWTIGSYWLPIIQMLYQYCALLSIILIFSHAYYASFG